MDKLIIIFILLNLLIKSCVLNHFPYIFKEIKSSNNIKTTVQLLLPYKHSEYFNGIKFDTLLFKNLLLFSMI